MTGLVLLKLLNELKEGNNIHGLLSILSLFCNYSKTGLKWPLKKKTKKLVSKTVYHLMQVKNIAECSKRALFNTFDLH